MPESARRRPTARYTGAELSDKQVDWSVYHGQLVTAYLAGGHSVTGYVYGADRYHWSLVSGDLDTYLVPRSSALAFGPAGSYAAEPRRADLDKLVAPYRRHLAGIYSWSTDGVPRAAGR